MRSNGVTVAVTQDGPDGTTTVLPIEAWRQQLQVSDDQVARDLLAWDTAHYARPSANLNITARSVCPDCKTSFREPNQYCGVHRCRALNSKGKPCTKAAHERHALMYCLNHGCAEVLGSAADGLNICCPERAERGARKCGAHKQAARNS